MKKKKLYSKDYKNNNPNLMKKNAPPPKYPNSKKDSEYEEKENYNEKQSDNSMQSKILKYGRNSKARLDQENDQNDNRLNRNMDINMNIRIHSKRNNGYIYNYKSNYNEKISVDEASEMTRMEKLKQKKRRLRKINYKFNIFEVICSSFCNCCLPENLERKHNINEKANDIIFNKLDLVNYVRSMILLDKMNDIALDENKKNILNFLSRPIISLNIDKKYKILQFYKNYRNTDFDRFYDSISQLVHASKRDNGENKLISFSNKGLKDLV